MLEDCKKKPKVRPFRDFRVPVCSHIAVLVFAWGGNPTLSDANEKTSGPHPNGQRFSGVELGSLSNAENAMPGFPEPTHGRGDHNPQSQ